ncbi:MAG: hypothetical protein J6Y32_01205 [Bacteroidales bacterium]|nr:hypothetical protein [Bacteroidales bacterium]
MKSRIFLSTALCLLLSTGAFAAEAQAPAAGTPAPSAEKPAKKSDIWSHLKPYGFLRTYFAFDTHESYAGTEELFYFIPKDRNLNPEGEDLNETPGFRFAALTSRLGLDIFGFEVGDYKFGGKFEMDFFAGLGKGNLNQGGANVTGTAQLRLRQAYVTVANGPRIWKIGQAWHPFAADLPDIFSLDTGMPFGAFNRSPQVNFEWNYTGWGSITAALLWQMQYTSTGPIGEVADYIKYSCTPECYLGFNFKTQKSLFRIGGDVLSIKPRRYDATGTKKVKDRLTTFNAFAYAQTKADNWTFKGKVTYSNDGSHMNLFGGYGVNLINADGSWNYTATHTLSGWFTAMARLGNWQPEMLLGYIENIGSMKGILADATGAKMYWEKGNTPSSKVARAFRIQPELVYNIGKFQVGIEYMLTAAEYGTPDDYMHATIDQHWVMNHRVQALVKFSF